MARGLVTREELIPMVEALRVAHLDSPDCWYSCPKGVDKDGYSNCCRDGADKSVCECGADKHNAKVDEIVALLKG
jgi:hypothetical protein